MSVRPFAALTALFLVLVSQAMALEAQPDPRDCTNGSPRPAATTVFMMDGTTTLSAKDRAAWALSVDELFDTGALDGRIYLVQVRDSGVSYDLKGPYCMSDPQALQAPMTLSDLREGFQLSWSWMAGRLFPYLFQQGRALLEAISSKLGANPHPRRDNGNAAEVARAMETREAIAAAVRALADPGPETKSTDVRDPLFQSLQGLCAGTAACSIDLFSDLLDSDVEATLQKRGKLTPTQVADRDFQRLSKEYGLRLSATRLDIRAWGIGRGDAGPGMALKAARRSDLREYWSTFLRRTCAIGATGSSRFSLTDGFSTASGQACG